MKPLVAGPLVLALALLAAGPGRAMEVKTSHDAGVDFSAYRTYAWKAREGEPPNHPLAEGSPLDGKIRGAVDAGLARAGLQKVEAPSESHPETDAEPDLRLSYVAYVEDELTIEGTRREVAPGISWVGDPDAHAQIHYQHGTLVITIEDVERGEAVWSGWASDVATTLVKLEKKAEKAAGKIVAHFPPRD